MKTLTPDTTARRLGWTLARQSLKDAMSLEICEKHDCVHNRVCEACNLAREVAELTNDLYAARAELTDRELECAKLEDDLNHARARVERLEMRNC